MERKEICEKCGGKVEEKSIHPEWCNECFKKEWKKVFEGNEGKDFKWI